MSSKATSFDDWLAFSKSGDGSDPVACAKYFHSVVRLFIEVFLGYNFKTDCFVPSVFGKVKEFFGVIEEQQRKQLHIHMLIWVEGLNDYDEVHGMLTKYQFIVQLFGNVRN